MRWIYVYLMALTLAMDLRGQSVISPSHADLTASEQKKIDLINKLNSDEAFNFSRVNYESDKNSKTLKRLHMHFDRIVKNADSNLKKALAAEYEIPDTVN